MKTVSIFLALAALLAGADTVYHNGRIVTLSSAKPTAEAMSVSGGRIVAIGTNEEVLAAAGSARRIDLRGRTVLPGLIDSHTHPLGAALSEFDGEIPVLNSIEEVGAYLKRLAAEVPRDRLLFVPKVYSTRLRERRYPTRQELDAATGDRPAMTDNGYASVLNSHLLRKLNITRDTPEPPNGKIIRDNSGEPTGLILGAPQLLGALRASRGFSHEERVEALQRMQRAYNQVGITTTIDRGQRAEGLRVYQDLHRRGAMTVRTTVTYRIGAQGSPGDVRKEMEAIPFVTGLGDEWLRIGPIKTVVDGGILIGTAYLREPYGENTQVYGYTDPDYRGVLAVPRENVVEMARTANRLGWQMTAHTTGSGSIELLLEAYEAASRDRPIKDRRFTVTHGNFPTPEAIATAARLGVIFDVQPAWHHFDGPALQHVFGPRRVESFLPLRSMIDAGVMVAGGSDHMIKFDSRQAINAYNPFFGMWMAITRKMTDGEVLGPKQRITRDEALRMWTSNGAYNAFEEDNRGSLEPGKFADFAVISADYLTCPEDAIRDIEVLATVVGGRLVHGAL
jgi:predicted amidohydrolase YtcJ